MHETVCWMPILMAVLDIVFQGCNGWIVKHGHGQFGRCSLNIVGIKHFFVQFVCKPLAWWSFVVVHCLDIVEVSSGKITLIVKYKQFFFLKIIVQIFYCVNWVNQKIQFLWMIKRINTRLMMTIRQWIKKRPADRMIISNKWNDLLLVEFFNTEKSSSVSFAVSTSSLKINDDLKQVSNPITSLKFCKKYYHISQFPSYSSSLCISQIVKCSPKNQKLKNELL